MKQLQDFMDTQGEWSDKTFGKHDGIGSLHHLKQEVKELIEACEKTNQSIMEDEPLQMLSDLKTDEHLEFADCFILLLDAARRRGLTAEQLLNVARQKQQINFSREWGEPDANGVVNHIKQ